MRSEASRRRFRWSVDLKLRGRGYVLVRGRVVSLAMGRAGKGSFTKKGLSDGPC